MPIARQISTVIGLVFLFCGRLAAQNAPSAYFEASGTYQTHWAGLTGTGSWDCTGCGEAPPWSAASGGGLSLNGPGRTILVSFGSSTATATFEGSYDASADTERDPYGAQYSRLQGGSIAVYVLGPPGTPFRLQYSYSESVHAFKSSDEACDNYGGASFSAQFQGLANQNVTASQAGESPAHTASSSGRLEGVTKAQTRIYQGQVYSLAWQYGYAAGGVMNFKCDQNLTGGGEFSGTIAIAAAGSDSDLDGVPDGMDRCPNTPAGVPVNANGCPDSDGDGIFDDTDQCPNTPPDTVVDSIGCPRSLIRLSKRGVTSIGAGPYYAEVSILRASVRFPPGHPQAGQIDTTYNGPIAFSEEQPTSKYYNGIDGASLLPTTAMATGGVVEIRLRSTSNSTDVSGPPDAMIKASAPTLAVDHRTNPFAVDQWVDENQNGMYDWLEAQITVIIADARRLDREVRNVIHAVTGFAQDTGVNRCGITPGFRSVIYINPVCDGRHRANVNHELSDTVLHESRHAWQGSQAQRSGRGNGTDDDHNPTTPSNDDDRDFLVDVADFPTPGLPFNRMEELGAIGGSGRDTVSDLKVPRSCSLLEFLFGATSTVTLCAAEDDAVPFAHLYSANLP